MQRKYNEACLESAYNGIAKLFERVPLTTREGMEVQINDALAFARKPAGGIKVEDIVDDRLVVELEKEGFVDRIYKIAMVEDFPNRDRKRSDFSLTDGAASAPPGRRGFVDKKEVAG